MIILAETWEKLSWGAFILANVYLVATESILGTLGWLLIAYGTYKIEVILIKNPVYNREAV